MFVFGITEGTSETLLCQELTHYDRFFYFFSTLKGSQNTAWGATLG